MPPYPVQVQEPTDPHADSFCFGFGQSPISLQETNGSHLITPTPSWWLHGAALETHEITGVI